MSTTQLPSGTWQINPAETTVTASVKMMGVINVPATLAITSGSIQINDASEVTSVDIVADAGSYASKNAKRNEHVRSDDFLAAEAHPVITLVASSATAADDGYRSRGAITVKGKSSPVDIVINDVEVDGATGSFTATATADRKALGVDKMPAFIISREVDIVVSAAVTRTTD